MVRHSGDQQQRCHDGLVNFEEGFGGVVNYNYHSGICVAKLHLPYGYATQLRFNTMQQNMAAVEASQSAVTSPEGKTGLWFYVF